MSHTAWRTRKTVDLLRLLALQSGHPVPVPHLIARLWPDVPEDRGRASLRTAASTLRHVLEPGCLERIHGGLALREAWVDAVAFQTLAREMRSYAREGMHTRVVAAGREAEALYLGDFQADDDSGDWAATERSSLRETYRTVLEDAGDAALTLGWHRDAATFATRAVALDPCAERPVRTLMTAYAALAQRDQALRAFQQCRRALADELGVDPSPQTDRLHVGVLRGEVTSTPPTRPPFTGRHVQLQQVVGALADATSHERPTVLELRGDDGCGRHRLVDEACAQTGRPWREVDDVAAPLDADVVRVVTPSVLHQLSLAATRSSERPGVGSVTFATSDVMDSLRVQLVRQGWSWHRITIPRLTHDEVGGLAAAVLGGPLTASLVQHVTAQTSGTPASVVTTARALLRSGRVRSTSDGLTVVPDDAVQDVDAQAVLGRALDQLGPECHETMLALALLESPIDLDALLPALTGTPERASVRRALDRLVDLELLTTSGAGYRYRNPLVAAAVQAWSRPSVRRGLHARIAERAVVPALDRVHHWLKAGEPQLACAASIDASRAALGAGRFEEARECLIQARALSTMLGADPADQVELGEQLGDVCVRLGRMDEAAGVYAFTLREAVGLPEERRRRLSRRHSEAVARTVVGPALALRTTPRRSWTLQELGEQLGVLPDAAPSAEVEETLRAALQETASSLSRTAAERAAGIRILLVNRVLLPRRQLSRAKQVLEPVTALATRPDLVGRAIVSQWLPQVLLGDAQVASAPLTAAIVATDDPDARSRLQMLSLLASHDLGSPSAGPVAGDPERPLAGHWWRWLMVRTLAESGRIEEAAAWRPPTGGPPRTPLLRQLESLAMAELHEAVGDRDAATSVLRAAAANAVGSGSILLLPEVAARLVMLDCALDDGRAQDDFDMMDWALGGEPAHPRETYFRLLARAHVRAHNRQPERAAVSASAARTVAAEHGLIVLQARAEAVGRTVREMERRRRASDVDGGPDGPVPTGMPERRKEFARPARRHLPSQPVTGGTGPRPPGR